MLMTGVSDSWRLGRRPALDGLRAIAVLMVVAAHFDRSQFTAGGAIGVKVFFTLSGFLITALLLEELADRGRIELRAFYERRLLRLAPAFLVLLFVVSLLKIAGWPLELGWAMVVASAAYAANWFLLGTAGADGIHWSALGHTWSLAIEEQFYVVWPLVLIAAARWKGDRGVGWVAVAGAALSLVDVAATERSALATDVSAWCLLAGCMLAVLMHQRAERRPPAWLALPILVVVPLGFVDAELLVHVVVPLLTVLAIWVAAQRPVGWLAVAPMRWVGKRSYGLYLWHVPIAKLCQYVDAPLLLRAAVGISIALVLTELSWRFVEQPFLRLKRRRRTAATPDGRRSARTADARA